MTRALASCNRSAGTPCNASQRLKVRIPGANCRFVALRELHDLKFGMHQAADAPRRFADPVE